MFSDPVIITGLTTFGLIITGLLGYLGVVATGARRHAKAARFGVENEHPTNLRDDLDEKFKGLAKLIDTVITDLVSVKHDILLVRQDVTDDRQDTRRALTIERDRIRDLEQTKPKRTKDIQ